MQEQFTKKINNILENALNFNNISTINVTEEAEVVDVNSSIITVKGFIKISFEECVVIKEKYFGTVSFINGDVVKISLLNKTNDIQVGDRAVRTFKTLTVPVGEELIGRVINGLGEAIDSGSKISCKKSLPVERQAKSIIDRKSVFEPLETGIKVIDSLIPIGRGQRELILGDRQTGKTSIILDTILNQKNSDVICIYCSIGQRDNNIANIINVLKQHNAMKYTIVVHASGNETPGHQFIAPYAATSIAEYFMERGKHVLIAYDDLSKHAKAYRELSLLLGKNPGREAYPADIFYIHSRLLERSTKMKDEYGGGSITSLPVIETEAENISAYIPTNVISITDGQIYLNPTLFQKNILPAIDISKSVSRVGGSAQLKAMKQSIGTLGIEYSQFEELEAFSRFSTTLDEKTEQIINKGKRIREILKQGVGETLKNYEECAIFLCVNNGIFDNFELEAVDVIENIIINVINSSAFADMRDCVINNKNIPDDMVDKFLISVRTMIEDKNGKSK